MNELRLSLFDHARDGIPKPRITTWEEFVNALGPHRFDIPDKRRVPAFSPAEFVSGKPRLEKNVVKIWFGVLDIDLVNADQILRVCEKLQGHDAVLYTTWSHPGVFLRGLWKIRVCVRFSRPVDPVDWHIVWPAMSAYFCSLNDPAMNSANEIYFGPSVPPGTDPTICHYITFQGQALDIDTLPTQAFATGPVLVPRTERVSRERLERLATRWRRSKDPYRSEMGEALWKVCKGEIFAEQGNADNTIFRLMCDLAKALPDALPESVAEHFAHSLQIMGPHRPGYEKELVSKFERAQEKIQTEVFAQELAQTTERKLRIRQAFAHVDPIRESAYTEEEILAIAELCKCTRDELRKRWIIQRGALFYLLGPDGVYSPAYSEKDIGSAVLRDLAPAESAGVILWMQTISGENVRKPLSTLMAEYGSVATDYVIDMRAQQASYDSTTRLFTEAPCPIRHLTPLYDHDVAIWLELLTGTEHHHNVLNWIAQVTNLDLTCAALMFTGKKDTGKSLLAMGLSRLFTLNGPTALVSAMSAFNDTLAHCPFVFADEQLPKDFRGYGRTPEIREFIAARSRPYSKKFYPETKILGAIRLMVAANNENILAIQEHLSAFDIEAIGDRFYHVPVNAQAAEFLTYCDTKSFIHLDRIAKHALWLRDNFPTFRDGRFLIKSPNREFYRGLATQSGMRSAVCQWFVSYLKAPHRIDSRGDFGVMIKHGHLYVSPATVLDSWDVYVREPLPPLGRLAQAIGELSTRRTRLGRPNGTPGHFREIDTDHLYAWADRTEFASREEIDASLARDTVMRVNAAR